MTGKRIGQRIFRTVITNGVHKGKPKCIIPGCKDHGQNTGSKRKDGSIIYRKHCGKHHFTKLAKKRKMNLKEFQKLLLEKRARRAGMSVKQFLKSQMIKYAKKAGYDNVTDYLNSKHKYRRNRLNCCENVDGRLGFVCTTTIADKSMLEVDHINNKHLDNRKTNHQTICACCHRYKTRYYGHLTNLSYILKLFEKNRRKFKRKVKVKK